MLGNAASSTKFNRDASYRNLSKIASSQQKKHFHEDNNFKRCYLFCFHRCIPVLNLYLFQSREYSSVVSLLYVGGPGYTFLFVRPASHDSCGL